MEGEGNGGDDVINHDDARGGAAATAGADAGHCFHCSFITSLRIVLVATMKTVSIAQDLSAILYFSSFPYWNICRKASFLMAQIPKNMLLMVRTYVSFNLSRK